MPNPKVLKGIAKAKSNAQSEFIKKFLLIFFESTKKDIYAVNLITISHACHAGHYTKDIVIDGIDTDLGGIDSRDGSGGKDKLKDSVIDSGEITRATGLVFLGAKGEGIDIDAGVGSTGVVLERLDNIKVRALTLGEAVLSVKLKLGGDDRVLSPAVHVKGSLGKDEGSGIGEARVGVSSSRCYVITESSITANEGRGLISTEGTDGVGESIYGIGVIERLGTEGLVKSLTSN